MSESPRADLVAQQYQKWTYPEPIQNLEAFLANNWQWFDPSHAHRVLWPDRALQSDLDILIAGCGTNQAAVFAYTNRGSKVVAVDVSQPSLDHQKFLKDKYALKNLELHLLPIEELPTLGKEFDLVVSTGVLHHMDEPKAGMKAIADVLRPDGVAAIMLYARYGRAGVELMQAVFRDLGLRQDEQSLEMVKAAVASLGPNHPLRSYISIAPDLNFDAGVVDTFLHGRDRSYTVDDCLDLVHSAGLVFQDWFLRKSYYPPTLTESSNPFYAAVNQMPAEKMWATMERINTLNACHFFLATPEQRPTQSYRIDFSAPNALDYVPLFRYRAGVSGQEVTRPGWSIRLDPTHLAFMQHLDGERSIREIATRVARSGLVNADQTQLEDIGLELLEGLWRDDFIAIDLSGATKT
ncbi:MAG: class I SAM-dependent methyltransferase [Candidatus Nanopelagicales bacterium]